MDSQIEELTQQLEDTQKKVDELRRNVDENTGELKNLGDFQLKRPLDPFTQAIINDQILIPVTHNLVGTAPATAGNYNHFFTANRSYVIDSILVIWGTLGTDGGAVTLDIYKAASAVAIASGTSVLSSTVNLKGTINTVNTCSLQKGDLITLKQNDRLGLILTGTPTAVANLSVTVNLKQI